MFIEIGNNGDVTPIELKPRLLEESGEKRRWELTSSQNEFPIRIIFRERAYLLEQIENISKEVTTDEDTISSQINELLRGILDQKQSGFDDSDADEVEEPQPYDPHKIKIRSDRWSISHIFELIDEWNQVELSPDFQRGYVWDRKRQSQFIESLMLRTPVPAFYLSETQDGKYQVVDGLQRLTTIRNFMRNEFKLRYLEYLLEQEGKWFQGETKKEGIDSTYFRNLLQTQLTVNIIEPSSPSRVKFDIFRRINTGGKPLNNQEIRNCLSEPHTRNLINELAYSKAFEVATGGSISTSRMQAHELVLRFIGFWLGRTKKKKELFYRGNMTEFLDDTIEFLNLQNESSFQEIKSAFSQSMDNAFFLFGEYAFRKCLPKHLLPNARKQFINKLLFTSWSVVLSDYTKDLIKKVYKRDEMSKVLAKKLYEDNEYLGVVSYKTNDKVSVETAFIKAYELINQKL